MPSKLLDRLNEFLDEDPAINHVMPLEGHPTPTEHWPGGSFGHTLTTVQSIVIHETTGYPTYQSANGFIDRYTHGDGIGPQFYIDGNGTTFRLVDISPPRLTWHASYLNGVSVGIENGDLGDNHQLGPNAVVNVGDVENTVPAANKPAVAAARQVTARNYWRALSTNAEDLTAMKVFLLMHPGQGAGSVNAEGVLIWFGTATYDGPQDMTGSGPNFRRMLFTERNYRSLVLLCRYLAEELGIPRNFPVLPYEQMENNIDSVDHFRKIVVSDERADLIAQAAGTNTTDLAGVGAAAWYSGASMIQGFTPDTTDAHGNTIPGFKRHNKAWRRMLDNSNAGGFRGIHGHGFAGDIFHYDNHSACPGPFFDWHRFAREVWDWWWYPFDFVPVPPTTAVRLSQAQRPYRKARRETVLQEYYYDAWGQPADYTAARVPGDDVQSGANSFMLTAEQTPVCAMANGIVVAACIPNASPAPGQPSTGFVLARHEVFHEVVADRVDYNSDPTYFYSLTYFLECPQVVTNNVSENNPDWLNRFLVRLKETEVLVDLHTNHPEAALTNAWGRVPTGGGGHRRSLGDQVTDDATAYRQAANTLIQGNVAIFPQELRPGATPVRVILGDLLGFPGTMDSGQTGVLIDIFSVDPIRAPFSMNPAPVPAGRQMALPLAELPWWRQVCDALEFEMDAGKELPQDGMVWHYNMVDFLAWINGLTWKSEWLKYGIVDLLHAGAPPRPKSRR